ncbi:MAG: hypothetical protein OXH11_15345 [Candidatus Aminicenantes bacterium]|nr:hypothetical protein [Candidatus Aminicenantes bacterium]
MRPRSLKLIRLFLIVVLVTAMGAVVWSFLTRRDARPPLVRERLLSPELRQQSTEFEHTHHEEGRTVYKVEAGTSTETVKKIHRLFGVKLTHFGPDGNSVEEISGDEAIYRVVDNRIEFTGKVRIELSDGTTIDADRLKADLARNIVAIDEGFRFGMEKLSGHGRSLSYEIRRSQLRVDDEFELNIKQGADRLRVTASRALYDLEDRRVDLLDGARIQGPQGDLAAGYVRVFLTDDRAVERMFTSRGVRLVLDSDRTFTGESIHLFAAADGGRIQSFYVYSGKATPDSPEQRAVYEDPETYLEADRIDGLAGSPGADETRFLAHRRVVFRSRNLGLEEGRADELKAHLSLEHHRLKWLELRGKTELSGRLRDRDDSRESIHGDLLVLDLGADGVLDRATVSGSTVAWSRTGEGASAQLRAGRMDAFYRSGILKRLVATQGPVLRQQVPEGERTVESDRMEAVFKEGGALSVAAVGGVRWAMNSETTKRDGESGRLDLDFIGEQLQEARGEGQVVYREENPSRRVTVTARNAEYDAGPNLYSFSDPDGAHLHYSEDTMEGADGVESRTRADGFRVDADGEELSAAGSVQTLFSRPGKEPVLIQADRLVVDSGVKSLSYAGNPRILRESHLIAGTMIRLDSAGERLEVQDVDSTFWDPGGVSGRQCRIRAPQLVYQRSSGRAAYRGGVRMQSGHFQVKSSQLDFQLEDSPASTIQSIAAGGEVEIRQGDRRARGDHAVYHPREGRVELTGELAEVMEPLRGSASGRRVTLFVETDKIVID